jgi:hypothetical protein
MNDQLHGPTDRDETNALPEPEAARAALAAAGRVTLDNPGDRKVHAGATVGFAAIVAGFIGLSHVLEHRTPGGAIVDIVYVLGLVGVAAWQTRAARTWPAGTKRLSTIGVGASVIVALAGNMWLNYLGRDGSVPWGPMALVMVAALVPAVVAATMILRGRR